MKKFIKRLNNIIVISLTAVMIFGRTSVLFAYEIPSAPTPPPTDYSTPTPPPEPIIEESFDTQSDADLVAPTPPPAPDAPTLEEILNEEQTADTTQNSEQQQTEASNESDEEGGYTSTDSPDSTNVQSIGTEETSSGEQTGSQTADGQLGSATIETGNALNSAGIITTGNENLQITPQNGTDGVSVVNSGNGSESENNGSVTVVEDNTTIQDNKVYVKNDLDQTTNTGENSASKNVGNVDITTGDANTTGTIINAVNTNVDGVAVAEFNVVDDHVGDIILDFNTTCVSNCSQGSLSAVNSGNGTLSTNDASVDQVTNNNTFQTNDATVENNMTLDSNSGDNIANSNTGGDTSVTTGDANVSANILNLANNNLAGDIIYGVVNIFGDLIGDIILPESSLADSSCISCGSDILAANTGNGSESENNASVDQTINNNTFQFNDVNIENNLTFDAQTGDNSASKNTGGYTDITTGDTNIDAQVVNIANSNIEGGNWWLVIVNEAGNWVGRILGTPSDSNFAGSEGTEFVVNEAGEITVKNIGNGSDSENNALASQATNNTLVQENTANIVNNVNLSANTGGNQADKNTGGDSSIKTGDANIVANIVNFVNNNISGNGRLYVTVVNVFGSWMGDFVTPGYKKPTASNTPQGAANNNETNGQSSNPSISSTNNQNASGGNNEDQGQLGEEATDNDEEDNVTAVLASNRSTGQILALAQGNTEDDQLTDSAVSSPLSSDILTGADVKSKRVVKVNLAWLLVGLPFAALILFIVKRYKLAQRSA